MQTHTKAKAPKTPRPFQIHLVRLKDALASLGIAVPAARLQTMAAAFYGYRSSNALAAALAEGGIAVPEAARGHGQENLTILVDPVAGRPFGVEADETLDGLVVSPYGNLIRLASHPDAAHIPMRANALHSARRAVSAYTGGAVDWTDPEAAVADLIADLIRYRRDLQERDEADEDQDPEEVAAAALRCYMRECLGEIAHAGEPSIYVAIDDLAWDLTWTRPSEPCEAALRAYAPVAFESEPDYLVGDLIGDLMHVLATIDHASPIEALRSALRSLAPTADPQGPQITVDVRIGR